MLKKPSENLSQSIYYVLIILSLLCLKKGIYVYDSNYGYLR